MSRGGEFTPTTGRILPSSCNITVTCARASWTWNVPGRLPSTASPSKSSTPIQRVRALAVLCRVRRSLFHSLHNSLPHRPNSSLRRHSSTHRLVTAPPHHRFSIHLVSGDVPARTLRSWSRPLFYRWTYYPSGIKSAPPPGRKIRH
jgi:hypothetical protein